MRNKSRENLIYRAKNITLAGGNVKRTHPFRLYPYIDYSIKNGCYGWSYDKMDEEEIKILNKLYDEKHIVYSLEKIIVTRKFYNYIQDILATGYVEEFIRNE